LSSRSDILFESQSTLRTIVRSQIAKLEIIGQEHVQQMAQAHLQMVQLLVVDCSEQQSGTALLVFASS
jgi:hypothetical protein